MKLFELVRLEDETGISGTGVVAQGVEFDSGKCVMQWLTKINSTAVYDSIQDLQAIHGHGGKTIIRYIALAYIPLSEEVKNAPIFFNLEDKPEDDENEVLVVGK